MRNSAGLIVLDGPDGAGKTTLAEQLLSRVDNGLYIHNTKPQTHEAWNMHASCLRAAVWESLDRLVVVDRLFMSESIYGRVYRTGSEYPWAARHLDRLLYRFGALRIVCAPPVEYVEKTLERLKKERVELYHHDMGQVAARYLALVTGDDDDYLIDREVAPSNDLSRDYVEQLTLTGGVAGKRGWLHYDVTTHGQNLTEFVAVVSHELENVHRHAPQRYPLRGSFNLSGNLSNTSILLVGDELSPSLPDGEDDFPFMSPSGSSGYLAKVLHKLGVDESYLCVCNSSGFRRKDNDFSSLVAATTNARRVIALGRAAEARLQQHGLPMHAVVRHPQHARRFSHYNESYTDELGRAIYGY